MLFNLAIIYLATTGHAHNMLRSKSDDSNSQPIIRVSLDPPLHPYPELSQHIAEIERTDLDQRKEYADQVKNSFTSEMDRADAAVKGAFVQYESSFHPDINFVQTERTDTGSEIHVVSNQVNDVDTSNVTPLIDEIVDTNIQNEEEFFKNIVADIPRVVESVVKAFKAEIALQRSSLRENGVHFLQQRTDESDFSSHSAISEIPSNIRVDANKADWPTPESLALNMLRKSLQRGHLQRASYLHHEAELLDTINANLRKVIYKGNAAALQADKASPVSFPQLKNSGYAAIQQQLSGQTSGALPVINVIYEE